MTSPTPYNARLTGRIDVAPGLVIFRVISDIGAIPFTPGQFIVLGLLKSARRIPEAQPEEPSRREGDHLIRRAYSISSASSQQSHLEFYISLVTSGALTPRLFCLQPGDPLFLGPKAAGLFTLDQVAAGRNILMVATGTGLAPYMSMLRSHVLGLAAPARAMAVLQGARHSWDLGYRAELEALSRQAPHFRYLPVVSRAAEDPQWSGRSGRLTQWLAEDDLARQCGFPLDPGQTDIFLCGHPDMVVESAELLTPRGFVEGTRQTPGPLHMEKYW